MAGDITEDGAGGAANGALRSHPPNLLIGAPQQSLHSRLGDLAIDGGQRFPDYQQQQQQQHLVGNEQVFSTKVADTSAVNFYFIFFLSKLTDTSAVIYLFFSCRNSPLQAACDSSTARAKRGVQPR